MVDLTENSKVGFDELLTPKHSIPANIHSLKISGSQGRFLNSADWFSASTSRFEKISNPTICDPKQQRFNQLYLDAAKRSAARDKLNSYASIQKEKEADSFKTDRKLTKAESIGLFDRLNKEAEARQERYKMSKKIKEAQELKEIKQPSINKIPIQIHSDVVTRLLQYGENSKKKLEDRVRIKKEKEDEEIKNTPSVHKRGNSEPNSAFNTSPLKSQKYSFTSQKNTPNKGALKADSQVSTNSHSMKSANSPDKIIQKMQRLAKGPIQISLFGQSPENLTFRSMNFTKK